MKSGLDKESLSRELEDARRGRDAERRDTLIKKVCTFFFVLSSGDPSHLFD